MANHTTGAQRYNKRMDAIFEKSNQQGHTSLHGSNEGTKNKAIHAAMKEKNNFKSAKKFLQSRESRGMSAGAHNRAAISIERRFKRDYNTEKEIKK